MNLHFYERQEANTINFFSNIIKILKIGKCYANVMQMLCKQKFSHSLSRHQILKAIVKYKTHPSIIFKSFSLRFSSFYFSQVDKKMVLLKTSKFHKVVQESDPHVKILKENVDYFAEYTCFEIDEAINVRISV